MADYTPPSGALVTKPNTWTATQTFDEGLTVSAGTITLDTVPQTSQNGSTSNTGYGTGVLNSNTGNYNTAVGYEALYNNTTNHQQVALGAQALYNNTTGGDNVAVGFQTLYFNTTSNYNTAVGAQALYNNTTGGNNVAVGFQTLYNNTTGNYNTAVGYEALYNNTTNVQQVALGAQALYNNTTGGDNVAVGFQTLYFNTTGNYNTAVGYEALYNYNNTTSANGYLVAVGSYAGNNYTGSELNNIVIGYNEGTAGESNMIRLGNANSGVTGQGQVAFSQIGLVGLGVPPIYGSAQGVAIGTSSTVISSFTPTATGTFRVTVVVEAKAAATLDSLTVTYTSQVTGATLTQTSASTVALTANTGSSFSILCYATSASAVSVQATASSASDLYGTATIERLA